MWVRGPTSLRYLGHIQNVLYAVFKQLMSPSQVHPSAVTQGVEMEERLSSLGGEILQVNGQIACV